MIGLNVQQLDYRCDTKFGDISLYSLFMNLSQHLPFSPVGVFHPHHLSVTIQEKCLSFFLYECPFKFQSILGLSL